MRPFRMRLPLPSALRIRPRMRILSKPAAADEWKDSSPVSIRFRHGDEKPVTATLLIPVIYKCPLPQPLSFDILTNAWGCRGPAYLSPSILASLLTFSRKKCICKSPVFYSLRTLPSSVSCKSFACHSYENCRVYANNSHSGTYSSPASFVISLPPYLFASAPLPLPTTHSLQVP
jgi:hypothetical protein